MHRSTIKRKISDTLLGATYECTFNSPSMPTRLRLNDPRKPTTSHRPRAPIALKCSNLTTHKRLVAILQDQNNAYPTTAVDDPLHERSVVTALIASGGHDNVLQCYDHFITQQNNGDECVWIVTEYCGGGDLFSYLSVSASRGIGETKAVAMILQVARGVAFLQSRLGLAHRDLSLENVFLRNGICKLADFALATSVNERSHDSVGNQPYMAPEVVAPNAQGYDPVAADVWSLGVMLFMLVTGSPLVTIASRDDPRFVAVMDCGIETVLTAWGFVVSPDLVELLTSMLRADPTQRPTIEQVVTTLSGVEALSS